MNPIKTQRQQVLLRYNQEVRMKTLSGNIRGATEREMLHVSARFSLNTENSSVKQEKRMTSSAELRGQ